MGFAQNRASAGRRQWHPFYGMPTSTRGRHENIFPLSNAETKREADDQMNLNVGVSGGGEGGDWHERARKQFNIHLRGLLEELNKTFKYSPASHTG